MIALSHAALYARDLEATKQFFISFFSARAGKMYHNPRTGFRSYFLTFEDGFQLEIMSRAEVSAPCADPFLAGYNHLSFCVGSRAEVDRLTSLLAASGYPVADGPRTTGDSFYESCILGPEDLRIELTV